MSNHPVREQTTGTARNGEIRLPWERFTAQGEEPLLLISGLGGPMVEYQIACSPPFFLERLTLRILG